MFHIRDKPRITDDLGLKKLKEYPLDGTKLIVERRGEALYVKTDDKIFKI